MKRSILLAAIFAVICFVNTGAQYEPPDCLRLTCPNDYDILNNVGCVNGDSVMVDTCMCPDYDEDNTTSTCLYSKGGLLVYFKKNCYPFANLLGIDEDGRPADIIFPSVKALFEEIESRYSDVYISYKEFYPNTPDSMKLYDPYLMISFEKYCPVNIIKGMIKDFIATNDTIEMIEFKYYWTCGLTSVKDINNNEIFITPNPTADELRINLPNGNQDMIFIYSESGEKVREMLYSEKINISDLPTGIYFIQIGNYRNKFIKK